MSSVVCSWGTRLSLLAHRLVRLHHSPAWQPIIQPLCHAPLPWCAGVLAARGHHLVRRQLLVGFDPLPLYTCLLQRRLGDLAVVCADWVGGRQVALKWRTPALAPAPLRPEAAHLCCPTGTPEAAPAEELTAQRRGVAAGAGQHQQEGGEDEGISAAAVVPDLVAVLADALQLCEGLVESACLQ